MAKKILAVETQRPGDVIDYADLKSKRSLLDYDIAIITPEINDFLGHHYEEFQGKRCLDDYHSFSLKEHIEHWRREILDAVRAGKTIFLFLNEKVDVYVATGKVTHSGTGRNARATKHVDAYSNYNIIPGNVSVTNAEGSSMKLSGKENFLSSLWQEISEIAQYSVLISGEGLRPLIVAGDKAVGAYLKYKGGDGTLILLPYIDFFHSSIADESLEWNEKGLITGKKFIGSICEIDKFLKEEGQRSPTPGWVDQEKFSLFSEKEIKNKLLVFEKDIAKIQAEKEFYQSKLDEQACLKGLLYEQGKKLESVVFDALKIIGFSTSSYKDSESEFDVVFESAEGRLIGEVEGKDNKAIDITKLRQLQMNITEDYARESITQIAKGALIGNASRLLPPEERGDFFTEKCITAAKSSNTVLIKTTDLFEVVKYLLETKDEIYARKCRMAISGAIGVISFPGLPNKDVEFEETALTAI